MVTLISNLNDHVTGRLYLEGWEVLIGVGNGFYFIICVKDTMPMVELLQ